MKLDKVRMAFGRVVASQRELRRMSQSELGHLIGMSQVSITKIETGKQAVSLEQALVLGKILGISLDRIPISLKVIEE